MPLEHARLRAVEALRTLRHAQTSATPSSFTVELVCNALQTVRDLLLIHGDELRTPPTSEGRVAVLQFLAHELQTLILALEFTAVRAESLLRVHGGERVGTTEEASRPQE
jgi:hypothetical protein